MWNDEYLLFPEIFNEGPQENQMQNQNMMEEERGLPDQAVPDPVINNQNNNIAPNALLCVCHEPFQLRFLGPHEAFLHPHLQDVVQEQAQRIATLEHAISGLETPRISPVVAAQAGTQQQAEQRMAALEEVINNLGREIQTLSRRYPDERVLSEIRRLGHLIGNWANNLAGGRTATVENESEQAQPNLGPVEPSVVDLGNERSLSSALRNRASRKTTKRVHWAPELVAGVPVTAGGISTAPPQMNGQEKKKKRGEREVFVRRFGTRANPYPKNHKDSKYPNCLEKLKRKRR